MFETATLHFDLGHLAAQQKFTLHVGVQRYALTPHTPQSLAQSRRDNSALALFPDERVSHFAESVQLPSNALVMLRVTAPKRSEEHPLDRLVQVSLHIPRATRAAGVAKRKGSGLPAKLKAQWGSNPLPPDEKIIIDIGNYPTALDTAKTLIFLHPELLALQTTWGEKIYVLIDDAEGLTELAGSIYIQSTNHDGNWVMSDYHLSKDYRTGNPTGKNIYVWSDETLEMMALPLQDILRKSKDTDDLKGQCWTTQAGIVQVPLASSTQNVVGQSPSLKDAAIDYTVKQLTPQYGVENKFAYDASTATATASFKNNCLRWLQVTINQFGPNNEPVGILNESQGYLSPVDTIMAIPLPVDWSDIPFTFDPKASSAVISLGGLGQPPYELDLDFKGLFWTSLFNLAIPTLFIIYGVAADQIGSEWSEMTKKIASKGSMLLEAGMEGPLGGAVSGSVSTEDILSLVGNIAYSMLTDFLVSEATSELAIYIAETLGESALEDAEPFIGWIAKAIGAAADLASITETIVAVASSPATMSLSILRTMALQVTVNPDPKHFGKWPATATHYRITATYDDGPTYVYDGKLDNTTQQGAISHVFTSLPAGGSLTVLACFYSDTGWLAGRGKTGPMPALPTDTANNCLVVPAFAIVENLVPLSTGTTYFFKEKLVFGSQGRVWAATGTTPAPADTVSSLNGSNVGNNLAYLGAIELNESKSAFAYLWRASGQNLPRFHADKQPYSGQLYAFQALGDGSSPESGLKFPGFGYDLMPCLALPPPTMAQPFADGFLLEPTTEGNVMYLRALSLDQGQPLIVSPKDSFGLFTGAQDDLAIHPAGFAVALSKATCKLQVVKLAPPQPDAKAPVAAILSGKGSREGLLQNPVALTCSLDRILVLQTTDASPQGCIVSFDHAGNPVYDFTGSQWSIPLRSEGTAAVKLVDVSVESKGYLYVLKYLYSLSGIVQAADYRLDIYNPDGSFLAQVRGIAAASLHVDIWRNVYTLDYEILQGSGRTEPSMATWIPSTPSI